MTTVDGSRQSYDVVVVGGGQAGLAIGYFLRRQERHFVILDAAVSIGSAWRARWDSLVLFTPRRYDGLPGLPFPGDPDGYPTRDEVIAYLENYREKFALPLDLGSDVRAMTKDDGTFLLDLDGRTVEARQVVVATGPFQTPRVPDFADELAPEVFQTHSQGYRAPSDVPEGSVLVVGGGNTGYQIASELSSTHHVSPRRRRSPEATAAEALGPRPLLVARHDTPVQDEHRLPARAEAESTRDANRFESTSAQAAWGKMKPRMTGASGRTVSFVMGATSQLMR